MSLTYRPRFVSGCALIATAANSRLFCCAPAPDDVRDPSAASACATGTAAATETDGGATGKGLPACDAGDVILVTFTGCSAGVEMRAVICEAKRIAGVDDDLSSGDVGDADAPCARDVAAAAAAVAACNFTCASDAAAAAAELAAFC